MAADTKTAVPPAPGADLDSELRRVLKRELDRLMTPWSQAESSPSEAPPRNPGPRD